MKKLIGDLAHGRSGDKGNDANIALFAYTEEGYRALIKTLTEEKMLSYFSPFGATAIERYPVPNLMAINFVVRNVLDGGGSLSLRSDSQGKALAQVLLLQTIDVEEG
jgi:hypothetical protein